MRWLLIGLLISVGALLFAAGAMVRHVLRQRRLRPDEPGSAEVVLEIEAQKGVRVDDESGPEGPDKTGGT